MQILRAIVLGLVLAGITFLFTVTALHPYRGLTSWAPVNSPEKVVASIFATLVFVACVWRVARGSSTTEEGRTFFEAIRDADID